MTPVTQADIECEEAIRETILERFPEHRFLGEETGETQSDADHVWLVDPIDGTKSFVRHYPFFSTQIALLHDGEVVLGVSSGTMMDELAWAEKGKGAWLNGRRLQVRLEYLGRLVACGEQVIFHRCRPAQVFWLAGVPVNVALVDRQSGAEELFAERSYPYHGIYTKDDFFVRT